MTQLQSAVAGAITPAMRQVAEAERVAAEAVRDAVARGHAVIPLNPAHGNARPVGVGRLFRTKVNANIGRSTERSEAGGERRKLAVSLAAGADFVMDLSVGPDLHAIRQALLDASPAPLGTVVCPHVRSFHSRSWIHCNASMPAGVAKAEIGRAHV